MRYWLLKSEPDDISIDDIAAEPARSFAWTGIRNYQARNFLREMQVGDLAFFYHSSCAEIGIAGVVEIVGTTYPDPTQFDESSRYFDPKATPENPRWLSVEIRYVKKTRLLPLGELKSHPELEGMKLLAKGSRLSVSPVEAAEWRFIEGLFKA
ncbi:EVE domain-containing protein [Massilia sp. AB1]|uniref:EVE domain-containing protein n=1 Tax=Massilia sp. AB1 TaxID=2823371 RepID=UPI001B835EA5|nr:EVE domain-containing protein [Massilia sp. AB1]MBQ5941326.1 EVE domain-containing protein [Massilia sp. AB1]